MTSQEIFSSEYTVISLDGHVQKLNLNEENKYLLYVFLKCSLMDGSYVFAHDGNKEDISTWNGILYLPSKTSEAQASMIQLLLDSSSKMNSFQSKGEEVNYYFPNSQYGKYASRIPKMEEMPYEIKCTLYDIPIIIIPSMPNNNESCYGILPPEKIFNQSNSVEEAYALTLNDAYNTKDFSSTDLAEWIEYLLIEMNAIIYTNPDNEEKRTVFLPYQLSKNQKAVLYNLGFLFERKIANGYFMNQDADIEKFYNEINNPKGIMNYMNINANPEDTLSLTRSKKS